MRSLSTAQFASARVHFNDSVVSFFTWWMRELQACIPTRWRALFAVDARCIVLRLGDDRIELRDVRNYQIGKPARETVVAAGDATHVLQGLRTRVRGFVQMAPVYVRVPLSRCLVRHVVIPAVALRRLDDVLALDLERTTPFRRQDVFSATQAIKTTPANAAHVPVAHIVFKAGPIEALLHSLVAARIDCAGIEVEAADGSVLPVRLTHGGSAQVPLPRPLAHLTKIAACLLIGVALTSVAALGTALFRREQALAALQTETSALQKRAVATRQRLTAAQSALVEAASPRLRKIESMSVLQVLEEVSRVLPDEAWVGELQLGPDGIVIDGHARSAAELIGLLSRAPAFRDVSFVTPVTRDAGKGQERFRIKFRADQAKRVRS